MSGWAHAQLLGAAPASTCEYYERGLLSPGKDDPQAVPYLRGIPDPLDDDGNVVISQQPGLGLDIDWDYITEHRIR
jgi:L-alanine-DL-glutamate epimerase-like enolase superfamily enzyme